jgi:hypothetical protein
MNDNINMDSAIAGSMNAHLYYIQISVIGPGFPKSYVVVFFVFSEFS